MPVWSLKVSFLLFRSPPNETLVKHKKKRNNPTTANITTNTHPNQLARINQNQHQVWYSNQTQNRNKIFEQNLIPPQTLTIKHQYTYIT